MLDKIKLNIIDKKDLSYEIVVGEDLTNEIATFLKKTRLGNRILVITDSNIRKKYGIKFLTGLKKHGLIVDLISFVYRVPLFSYWTMIKEFKYKKTRKENK